MHVYSPWWLDNKKLDFARGYHIEVWGGMGAPTYGTGFNVNSFNKFFGINKDSNTNNDPNYFNENDIGWYELGQLPVSLKEIFKEVGQVYIPCLIANHNAYVNNKDVWEIELEDSVWKQKTFPYQSKCLNWNKEEFNILSIDDKNDVKRYLNGTGCELILE